VQSYPESAAARCFEEVRSRTDDCLVHFVALLATDDDKVGIVTGFEKAGLRVSIEAFDQV
jgi:hypothetical protein